MHQIHRDYIRHPLTVPIRLSPQAAEGASTHAAGRGRNVSRGGLCCIADRRYHRGETLRLRIDAVQPVFETSARVIWCQPLDGGLYEVGCRFLSGEDAFAARMVEQVCHIEAYRTSLLAERGIELSQEEAAAAWIASHAEGFPGGTTRRN
mgnify:CR=1 FL=1